MATEGAISLQDGASKATVLPSRGGMATQFSVGGKELFFLDESTVVDASKNVRGGAPVLFPSPGKLTGDTWARDGRGGHLNQHGFARNRAWAVSETSASAATLCLGDDDESRAGYPYRFACALTYAVGGERLRIDTRVENLGDVAMPFGFGFHPYFRVPVGEKTSCRVGTTATRAFDNVRKTLGSYAPPDLAVGETDLHLLDHRGANASLSWDSGGVVLRGSPEYAIWVLWTVPGRDFVCLEPWTCRGDALNTGEGLMTLAPGEARALWLEIAPA